MFLGHWPELLAVLFIALLVFGPKRMIEMGSSFGKAFREFREATKELSWTGLLSGSEEEKQTPLSHLSQIVQSHSSANESTPAANPPAVTQVVDADEASETPGAN